MTCLVCNNNADFTRLFPDICETHNYLCNSCGLVFIKDRKETMPEYYKDDGYFKKSPNLGVRKIFFSKSLFEQLGKKRLQDMDRTFKIDWRGKTVVDVGCGYGHLLYAIRNKYKCDVFGIEPSPKTSNIGHRAFNISIASSTLEEYQSTSKFDIVICNHTLEHVNDPIKFLKRLKSLMKRNGLLYLVVPNILKPTGGFNLNLFLYPEHLQTFSAYNLSLLLGKVDLKTVNFNDDTFLMFLTRKDHGTNKPAPKVDSSKILEFLTHYKNSYTLLNYAKVYTAKVIYLLKIIKYKIVDLLPLRSD